LVFASNEHEKTMKNAWTIQDSSELYLIPRWGAPYFSISAKGHLVCAPKKDANITIDLKELVDDLCLRGIQPPLLVRFNDILEHRIATIVDTFEGSIKELGYKGEYRCVMPIKVNQQCHVVEQLVEKGRIFHLGLEAGSKPELLVATALLHNSDALLICNGYKDTEYIETALHAQRLGLKPFMVLDRFAELDKLIGVSRKINVSPLIGIRAKLSNRGKGRWEDSSGDRSKFGLCAREIVQALNQLRRYEMVDCLKLLHFHIGSQITSIRAVKNAVREAAHLYCNLRKMGATELSYIDIGGGLAVDYDGSQTNFHSSMNYSTHEYAKDVISVIQEICDSSNEPHPTIVSESGRALVAHHAALVFNVLGSSYTARDDHRLLIAPKEEDHSILHTMWEAYQSVSQKNFQQAYNDISTAKEEGMTLFGHGMIDLESKARVDDLYWSTCHRIREAMSSQSYIPEDLAGLAKQLSDTYFCNFSVFQSLPDSWAVRQLFPIVPLHRLGEEPSRDAILADLTCDSDGKIDQFIDLRDVSSTLKLHAPNDRPYYLGVFLVGAYQEILGDLHNLFGDTNTVHVSLGNDGTYRLDHVLQGDSVAEVLSYVEYDRLDLIKKMRSATERALREGRLSLEESAHFMKRYEEGLAGYTYLEDID
jgi:arginine decarboxylase